MNASLPDGYVESAVVGTLIVAQRDCHAVVCDAIRAAGTLHAWAAAQPGAEALQGRGVAWGVALPGGLRAVVRHSRHGGLLAPLTRDLFLTPARAPRELATALRLEQAGIPTPRVLAYAVYTAAGPLCRADVVTARVEGVDLATALREQQGREERHAIRVAVSRLMHALHAAGATHPDLNARNVLVARPFADRLAYVLDVDRVSFGQANPEPPRGTWKNVTRLQRSLLKLREAGVFDASPGEIAAMSHPSLPDGGAAVVFPPQ